MKYRERIPCTPETVCFIKESGRECFEDIHHEAFEEKDYRTALEKKFREHVLNKILICRAMHVDHHQQKLLPVKPTEQQMKQFIGEAKKHVLLGNKMEKLQRGGLAGNG